MSQNTTYLITGANRGIGLGLTQSLLRRPNTTVIACMRERASVIEQNLLPSDRHPTSTLETITLDSTSDTDFQSLKKSLGANGATRRVDVVIANAGSSANFASVLDTPLDAFRSDFEVNTLGPLRLFQTCYDHISVASQGKFVLISSILGSIGLQDITSGPTLAYGASKAAANFLIRKIHFEHENIIAVAIHPGWVKTDMGQGYADAVGIAEPPMTLDICIKGVLEQIDSATREATAGSFISYNGTFVSW